MSAQIYSEIRSAISAYYPEKLDAFRTAMGREGIIEFLNTNFPLDHGDDWKNELLTRIPDILKARKAAEDSMA